MWEYKIKQTELWYVICKIRLIKDLYNASQGFTEILYWTGEKRTEKVSRAKEYIFQNDALSSLMVAKRKWNE